MQITKTSTRPSPYSTTAFNQWTRTDLMEQVGIYLPTGSEMLTWETFAEAVRQIDEDVHGIAGNLIGLSNNYFPGIYFWYLLHSNGGDATDAPVQPRRPLSLRAGRGRLVRCRRPPLRILQRERREHGVFVDPPAERDKGRLSRPERQGISAPFRRLMRPASSPSGKTDRLTRKGS
jgi:hypothetical protein